MFIQNNSVCTSVQNYIPNTTRKPKSQSRYVIDPKYAVLRSKLERLIDSIPCGSYRAGLGRHLRDKFPELWIQVALERRGVIPPFDIQKLFTLVGVPVTATCRHCGNPTGFNKQSLRPRDWCSAACVSRDSKLQEDREATSLANFGETNYAKTAKFKEEYKESCLASLGVSNPSKSKTIRAEKRTRFKEKHGVDYLFQLESFKEESKEKSQEKYGTDYPQQAECVKKQIVVTRRKKYGVDHHMQNAKVLAKTQKSRFTLKQYVASDGKVHWYQGYEDRALRVLDGHPKVLRFETTASGKVPKVRYTKPNGRTSKYTADIKVWLKSGKRLLLEVKSAWTLYGERDWATNLKKFEFAERFVKGTNHEFWLLLTTAKGEITWIKDPIASGLSRPKHFATPRRSSNAPLLKKR